MRIWVHLMDPQVLGLCFSSVFSSLFLRLNNFHCSVFVLVLTKLLVSWWKPWQSGRAVLGKHPSLFDLGFKILSTPELFLQAALHLDLPIPSITCSSWIPTELVGLEVEHLSWNAINGYILTPECVCERKYLERSSVFCFYMNNRTNRSQVLSSPLFISLTDL